MEGLFAGIGGMVVLLLFITGIGVIIAKLDKEYMIF